MAYIGDRKVPGTWALAFGVIFPGIVVAIELASRICARTLFDPMPTMWHALLVISVPVTNLLLWRAARAGRTPRWLAVAGGSAVAIAACYTILLLPLMPVALIAILYMGLGLLPFGPLASLIVAVRRTLALGMALPALGGAALGLLALTLADLPASATHLALLRYQGDAASQRSAVQMARTWGDREMLRKLAHGDTLRATGLLSYLISSWGRGIGGGRIDARSGDARELFYRVTGEAFNAQAPGSDPYRSDEDWFFNWDRDRGGETVGGRVDGLSLASSRIDGSVADADNLGYFEWTWEIANADSSAHEARFTLALPEGAVASRATLWVNGEPREASVAGRGEVRAAYQRVVSASRDPLLVTTDGAQRLLIQAFPINANDRMKLRVGFTAPFAFAADGKRSIAMPAIVERNFEVPGELRHAIWIEGDGAIRGGPLLRADGAETLRGTPTDAELLARRPRIHAEAFTAPVTRTGTLAAEDKVPALAAAQTIAPAASPAPAALTIVLDGSASGLAAGKALGEALDTLPQGVPLGLRIASETPVAVPAAAWSPAQRDRFAAAIARARFKGGQDNLGELAAALAETPAAGGTLLWIHGPQPVPFTRSSAALEQQMERAKALPRLVRYQPEQGRAFTMQGARWFETARELVPGGDPAADLRGFFAELAPGTRWTTTRAPAVAAQDAETSAHIVRLWAAGAIAAAPDARGKAREESIKLAHRLNLITPVSGAVVLETDRDYRNAGLPVPGADAVPTVPEPHEWALLGIVVAIFGWLLRQRRRLIPAAA